MKLIALFFTALTLTSCSLGISQQNRISNIKSLSDLNNLDYLSLSENPIEDTTCPVQSASVCAF